MHELDKSPYRPESDPNTVTYHVFHDMAGDQPVSSSVAMALTTLFETDGVATGPLAQTIDPDSIDSLFTSGPTSSHTAERMIQFVHEGVIIRIVDDGHITLRTRDSSA